NPSIKELAGRYNISEGKAALINELIQHDNKLTFEELALLSVHEIALIMESKGIDTKDVAKTGQASEKAYIGKEKAKEIAFSHAKVDNSKVLLDEIEFDTENGIIVYEIEFKVGSTEYEYDINALTGEIVHYSKEADDDGEYYNHKDENNGISEASYIGKEKALAIALSHSKVDDNKIYNLKIEIDYDDKRAVYEIEFETGEAEYEYSIDAITGKIIESEREAKESSTSKTSTSNNTSSKKYIGKTEAFNKALEHAGVSKSAVTEYEVDFDKDNGKAVYEIEFETSDREYDYEIDAYTGKVLKYESEARDARKTSKNNTTPVPTKTAENYIGKTKAKEIAFSHAKVDAGKVKDLEIELDMNGSRAVYEIEFKAGNKEYDYEVDAVTGEVLKSEVGIDD
ncbi:MAG TPA: PepSY domain-containing protein, partial [Mobilitalea sp.]|nr:PepSY domain-containing protein [Mobilitalea sp.]